LLNKENTEKDDDDEFWMNTCNSFVVQLAETQEKKKVNKTSVKRKLPKEQLPQPPKRKYTKRIKIEPISESECDNKIPTSEEDSSTKPAEQAKSEEPSYQGKKVVCKDESSKTDPSDTNGENKTKLVDVEKTTDDIKGKEDGENELEKTKPKKKRVFKLKFQKPLITKMKKMKKEDKKELKTKKEEKKELKKEEKKELKKGEKKDATKKELSVQKSEKKELVAVPVAKEEKKGPAKKEEKLKKDQQPDINSKKDLNNKKEGKRAEAFRKKVAAEKENLTKNNENTTRRSTAEAAAGKFNPRQSLRRKNSLKDYTFAFDELLDDAFAHFEADKIPVKKRRKCASPSPSPAPAVVAASAPAAAAVVVKKPKEKDNETIRMRLRSRNRPLLAKQEPLKAAKKKRKNKKNSLKNKIIPKRRRKKSLGEKSAHSPPADGAKTTTDDWKDELYKFKRSLRLPSKLISVASPPSAVGPDQVSLTSIMNIPPHKPTKEPKSAKPASQSQVAVAPSVGKNCKTKRLGHLFGRRDVFKGRRLMNREKIVSAEKLMQRNQRKRRQQQDEEKKEGARATVALLEDEQGFRREGGKKGEEKEEDEDEEEEEEEEDEDDEDDDHRDNNASEKPPTRVLFKRKFMRKKFRSGFDYIKKKKKKEPVPERKPVVTAAAVSAPPPPPPPKCAPRYVSEIQADIKGWIVNKGHGETVLHRAARLGVEVSVFFVFFPNVDVPSCLLCWYKGRRVAVVRGMSVVGVGGCRHVQRRKV